MRMKIEKEHNEFLLLQSYVTHKQRKMKKNYLIFIMIALLAISCNTPSGSEKQGNEEINAAPQKTETTEDVKDKNFNDLFTAVPDAEIMDYIYKYVGRGNTVLTSGNSSDYNSMVAGWGGPGTMLGQPVTWCFLRANRYTLEYIRKEQKYTMSYFSQQYTDQVLFLGSKTGKGTEKMKESTLTAVATPTGQMSYKEAEIIIECDLSEITSVTPDDFYTQAGKDFVLEGFADAKDYHKMVFGGVTKVWIKK